MADTMILKRLILLISILISTTAIAIDYGANISGYIFYTTFSDTTFHNNRKVVAINMDADIANTAIRAQVAGLDSSSNIRRLVLEQSMSLYGTDIIYQIGRFGRVDSFYNGVLDSPGDYQMAILPFAGYSYRMYNGSFTTMDGHNLIVKRKLLDNVLVTGRAALGRGVIDEESLQQEAFHRYDPNIHMRSNNDNTDLSLKLESADWSVYLAKHKYISHQSTNSPYYLYKYYVNTYNIATYDLNKYGIQYDNKSWYIRSEITQGNTNTITSSKQISSSQKSIDYNIVSGKYFYNNTIYAGYSNGHNLTKEVHNYDRFIGFTNNYKRFTTSIEYHKGRGAGWVKYGVREGLVSWDTLVASISYSF